MHGTDTAQVAQSNTVSADATAQASTDTSQTISLPVDAPVAPDISAPVTPDVAAPALSPAVSQQITASQLAQAIAQASQTKPVNVSVVSSGVLSGLAQSNSATASAQASADLEASQTVSVGADGPLLNPAVSMQSVASSQSATASAQTAQMGAFNASQISSLEPSSAMIGTVEQANTAGSAAFADASGSFVQVVSQFQGGTGLQSDNASQTAAASQVSNASAQTSQAQVGNLNEVVIPAFGISNPSLSQINSVGSYAQTSSSSAVAQTVNQAVATSSDVFSFDLQASQDGSVIQSGSASSEQSQANRVNLAGWAGLVAGPQPMLFSSPPGTVQPQTVQALTVQAPVIGSAAPTMGFALPPTRPAGLPPSVVTSKRFPRGTPLGRPESQTYGSDEFGVRSQAGASEVAAASGPPTPNGPAPVCEQHCGIDLLFGAIGSARGVGSGSGDGMAALTRYYLFVPLGAEWVQAEEPAPGAPAFTSPIERPG